MRTYLGCFPCFLRQALDAARFATADEQVHATAVQRVLRLAAEMDIRQPPPVMGQQIHRLIRQITGKADPYRQQKHLSNELALGLYSELTRDVDEAPNPLQTALRLAIAGNILDFGVYSSLERAYVERGIAVALKADFDQRELPSFIDQVEQARDILYLGDNAGEIVFDRLLIEKLPREKVTFVVKGSPVVNDATMEDAEIAGLTEMVDVIDNGSDGPGTILESCSTAFRERFNQADLIIAKGQGNYESLSGEDKQIFFVLKAKCPVIARDLDCEIGEMVLCRRRAFREGFVTQGEENIHARL
jgi:hypothetical protein